MSAAILAFGAISALGEGGAAVSAGEAGAPARLMIAPDPELAAAGLSRPFAARARVSSPGEDRACTLLLRSARACMAELDATFPDWRRLRVGLALGTSSGGLRSAESVFSSLRAGTVAETPLEAIEDAFYGGPLLRAASRLEIAFSPATLVLGACAASTLAVGLATRWIESGDCDVALAGGFDAVAVLVAAGFEALRATTSELPPRPFRRERDGMALGEGAAVIALGPAATSPTARAFVTGFGASSDAVHLTAPDRSGAGLARAAAAALDEAGRPAVDLVSAHGTATPFSDAAESRALRLALGDEAAARVVVHPFKAQVGHTLGASGALESLVCVDALTRGVLPAAAGSGPVDPDTPQRLLPLAERGDPRVALKLSAAFGGANAALVLAKACPPRAARPRRDVFASLAVHVATEPDLPALAAELAQPAERVARADVLIRFALAAVAELARRAGPLAGAGIVVGEAFATLETDALFHARIEQRGARMAEPRRFPYTSPNAAAGECGVYFGLTGPGFAVGSGPSAGLEALVVACDLVRSGDADRVVVVAADHVGAAAAPLCARLGLRATSGAVALLVTADPSGAAFRVADAALTLGPSRAEPSTGVGHAALLPLVREPGADAELRASGAPIHTPGAWSMTARARLESRGAPRPR